jgi:hypothetical protein
LYAVLLGKLLAGVGLGVLFRQGASLPRSASAPLGALRR